LLLSPRRAVDVIDGFKIRILECPNCD
jgi:hypothetical protein